MAELLEQMNSDIKNLYYEINDSSEKIKNVGIKLGSRRGSEISDNATNLKNA